MDEGSKRNRGERVCSNVLFCYNHSFHIHVMLHCFLSFVYWLLLCACNFSCSRCSVEHILSGGERACNILRDYF